MKLWRGQPDHDHWKVAFSSRDKAKASFGIALGFVALALASGFAAAPQCATGRGLVCRTVRAVAQALGASIQMTETATWAGVAMLLSALAIAQWLRR